MSKQAFFVVYDLTTGDIKRHGKCPAEHVALQARKNRNEGVRADERRTFDEARTLIIQERMILPSNAAPYLRKRSAADIEARTPKPRPAPISALALANILVAKGVLKEGDVQTDRG